MIETLLENYASIQKLTKAKLKLKSKHGLTRWIMTSIKKKNKIYKKIIKAKNLTEKNIPYNEFKHYRNLVTKLSRISIRLSMIIITLQTTKRTWSKLGKELNYL